MPADDTELESVLEFDALHPEVRRCRSEVASGHYRHAVRRAAEEFANRVADMSGLVELSGRRLLLTALRNKDPYLRLEPRPGTRSPRSEHSEYNGFRDMALGLMSAVRNVFTHETEPEITRTEAVEWLSFISALHRILDRMSPVDSSESESERRS